MAALFLWLAMLSLMAIALFGCGDEPDTSAPQRQIIERTAGWEGALLYISDQNGPNPALGSVRIYDNISGFVEKTVDQTVAGAPADMFVTPDGGTMYVAGSDNGRVDKFRWDGNNWIRGGVTIDTPARSITAMAPAPDGSLYITANNGDSAGAIYRLNTDIDLVDDQQLTVSQIAELQGIAWSPDGKTVYMSGIGQDRLPRLFAASWPSLEITGSTDLTGASRISQSVVSMDGSLIYVMAEGHIYIVNPAASMVTGMLTPAEDLRTGYSDGALSADGGYLFATGNLAGEQASLYILDLRLNSLVKSVGHVADKARGVQRAE
ncbi:MAG: WD40 repeat domain-containing protein [Thermoleophilia bacterium]|nr:WD40 repeat domain-containing protein [Thermoleophilia bacterium]